MIYDMIRYDMIWNIIWYDMAWHDTTWYDMIWYDMLWYDMTWHGMTWHDMIWYDMIRYDMIYDIFVNCSWVATRWQQYSTHLHTKNTRNDTKQTIHRTAQQFGRVGAVPHLCGFYPGICLTTEEKAWKNLSQGSRRVPAGTMKIYTHAIRTHRHNNKNT